MKGAWSGHVSREPFKFWWTEAILVKYCTQVGYVKSQHTADKRPLKGVWSGSRDPLYILRLTMISLERFKLESSNFCTQVQCIKILAYEWQTIPKGGMVTVT